MQPRLKSSQKWTELPSEYIHQIRKAFMEHFGDQIAAGKLIIEGRVYPHEILLRVGYLETGRITQTNFEVSMDYKPENAVERIHNCIDAAASMMLEYFEADGEVDFPYTWKPYPFQDQTIYLQFSTENSELEAAADRILGDSNNDLVHENPENEDALTIAETDEELSGGQDMMPEVFGHEETSEENEEEGPSPGRKKRKSQLH